MFTKLTPGQQSCFQLVWDAQLCLLGCLLCFSFRRCWCKGSILRKICSWQHIAVLQSRLLMHMPWPPRPHVLVVVVLRELGPNTALAHCLYAAHIIIDTIKSATTFYT
jgi:hypothetical protein